MNNQKDTQRTGLNSYGQQVSSDVQPLAYKPAFSLVGLKYESANKKTEKLVTALYMVTDCMETDDSLKSKLRQLGVELLSDMFKLSVVSPMEKDAHISSSMTRVSEILSFIEIAYTIGFVSEMNTAILKKEFMSLTSLLESHLAKDKHFSFTLDEKMFDQEVSHPEPEDQNIKDKKTLTNTSSFINNKTNFSAPKVKAISNSNKVAPLGKQERAVKILSLIKDKKEVSIKDISTAFSCSEKTIQREVNDLIYKGQIKKTGSKRWSKYSIAI